MTHLYPTYSMYRYPCSISWYRARNCGRLWSCVCLWSVSWLEKCKAEVAHLINPLTHASSIRIFFTTDLFLFFFPLLPWDCKLMNWVYDRNLANASAAGSWRMFQINDIFLWENVNKNLSYVCGGNTYTADTGKQGKPKRCIKEIRSANGRVNRQTKLYLGDASLRTTRSLSL